MNFETIVSHDLFSMMINLLRTKSRFNFSRFGDGEFNAIFGKKGVNCDGHQYFEDMGYRLKLILEEGPDYFLGLQGLAFNTYGDKILRLTEGAKLSWINSNVFHRASIKNRLGVFFEVLQLSEVLIVGPDHIGQLSEFGFDLIRIPEKDCWLDYPQIRGAIAERLRGNLVILYCASMMSNILIDDFQGECTQIDIGSVFDPYCGVNSRTYHKDLKI